MFFVSFQIWLSLATGFCEFWLLLANIFVKFGYTPFWILATLSLMVIVHDRAFISSHRHRVARWAILRRPYFKLVGRTIFGLAVWLFWPFSKGRLAENFFVGRFWKYVYILRLNCQQQHLFWKSGPLCVRFALWSEL